MNVWDRDDVVDEGAVCRVVVIGLTVMVGLELVVCTTEVFVSDVETTVCIRYFAMVFTGVVVTDDIFLEVRVLVLGVCLMGVIVAALHFQIWKSPSARVWEI